jgi:thioredoxin 1
MLEITNINEFFELIIKEQFVLLDCFGVWCGPCKMMVPILEQLSNEYENITFCKIDIDQVSEITKLYNIRSIPTLLLFKDNQEIARQVGAVSKKQLEEFINKHLGQEIKGYEKEISAVK